MDKLLQQRKEEWIFGRMDDTFRRLKKSEQYLKLRKKQDKNEEIAERELQKLKKHERITVRRYYEYDAELRYAEAEGAYAQGWRDGITLMIEMYSE